MQTFYAILRGDKSKCIVIYENGIKMVFRRGEVINLFFDFKKESRVGSVVDNISLGVGREYITYFVRVEFDEKPETSEFRVWNECDGMLGDGWLVTDINEFERAKNLLEDQVEYIRNTLDELIVKCANGEVEKETVDRERGLLKRLETVRSSFLKAEEDFEI